MGRNMAGKSITLAGKAMIIRTWAPLALAAIVVLCLSGCQTPGQTPAQAGKPAVVGYSPATDIVRLWDTMGKDSHKHYGFDAWKRRDKWVQVPWGNTNYKFKGDPAIEGKSFWISLHSSRHDAVFLYAKVAPDGKPSRHNEIYRSCDAPITLKEGVNYYWNNVPGRVRCFGGGSSECRIIKNHAGEIVVESAAIPYVRGGKEIKVVTRYRVPAGMDWLEITPVSQANEQGMHGETRFLIAPDGAMHKCDYVVDAWKQQAGTSLTGGHGIWLPDYSRMSLDLVMDADLIWLMTWPDPFKARPYAVNCWGGYQAGWHRIGEGLSTKIISSPFARFGDAKEPVVIGVLYKNYWHYQRINQKVTKDQKFTGTWKRVYQRGLPHGTYPVGSEWKPGYPGIWRTIAYIKMDEKPRFLKGIGTRCEYYTQEVKIGPKPTAEFSFTCPVAGTLEYLITYLYDRTEDTPKEVSTPMDIYRQAIQGEPVVGAAQIGKAGK